MLLYRYIKYKKMIEAAEGFQIVKSFDGREEYCVLDGEKRLQISSPDEGIGFNLAAGNDRKGVKFVTRRPGLLDGGIKLFKLAEAKHTLHIEQLQTQIQGIIFTSVKDPRGNQMGQIYPNREICKDCEAKTETCGKFDPELGDDQPIECKSKDCTIESFNDMFNIVGEAIERPPVAIFETYTKLNRQNKILLVNPVLVMGK